MKIQKTKYFIFAAVITVAVIAGIIIIGSGNNSKFKDQLKLGNEALLNMDYEGAITAFANAIGLNPKDVEAYLGISKAYIALEDYSNATDYLSKGYYTVPAPTILGMLEPVEVKDLVALGKEFLSKGEANLSEDAFEEALKKDPTNEEAEKGKEDAINHPNYNENDGTNNDANQNADVPNNNQNNTNNNTTYAFHPSEITFMGYPVTEDHYEEWKAALNYTGDDTVPQNSSCSNEFSNDLYCWNNGSSGADNYGYIRQISLTDMDTPKNNLPVYLGWYDYEMPRSYMFVWNDNPTWNHIAEQYVSSPIRLGMTYEEALAVCGYTGEITFTKEPFSNTNGMEMLGYSYDTYNGISIVFNEGIFAKLSLLSHDHTGVIDSIYLDTYITDVSTQTTNTNDTPTSSSSDKNLELGFNPFGFTFMGYPIHEDHFEDWKSALGFVPDERGYVGPGNGYGLEMQFSEQNDKTIYLIDKVTENGMSTHVDWHCSNSSYGTYSFIIRPSDSYSHVANYFSGPFALGDSLTDVLTRCGYTNGIPNAMEDINLDNGLSLYLLNEKLLLSNEYYDAYLQVLHTDFTFGFAFSGDTLTRIDLSYNGSH